MVTTASAPLPPLSNSSPPPVARLITAMIVRDISGLSGFMAVNLSVIVVEI